MSEEPEIIHSNQPHQVSIPEGSHVAVAKTGTPQEPSVHKNYRPGTAQEPVQAPDRYAPDTSQETAALGPSHPTIGAVVSALLAQPNQSSTRLSR